MMRQELVEETLYSLKVFMDDKRVIGIGNYESYDDALNDALTSMEDPHAVGYRIQPFKYVHKRWAK
ncbi:hypothetical protein ACENW9_000791 [Escherichia coli]